MIDRYIFEGKLVQASLSGKLLATYNATAIKELLKKHGLPVSGTKDQGIARLVQSVGEELTSLVSHLAIYECSAEAREVALRFAEEREALKQEAEQSSLSKLQNKDFFGAASTVASYELKQVTPRGLNVNYNSYPATEAKILEAIYKHRPKILIELKETEWEPLRTATAMTHLWGTNRASMWLPVDFVGVSKFNNDTVARMLMFHAQHMEEIKDFRANGLIQKVEMICSDDSCAK